MDAQTMSAPGTAERTVVEAPPTAVVHRTWETMITLRESERGPLQIRHAPLLATGDLGGGAPMSSILMPAGLRASLVRSLRLADADVGLRSGEAGGRASKGLAALRADIAAFDDLTLPRQAEVLSCLNCITEQAVAVPLVRNVTSDHLLSVPGGRVLYEVGRVLLRIYNPQAHQVFQSVAESGADPVLRISGRVQLGAMAVRQQGDLDSATAHVQAAWSEYAEAETDLDDFLRALLQSRVSRLAALVAMRTGDTHGQSAAMERSLATALELERISRARSAYDRLVSAENMKIVAESHLKAAGGAGDSSGVVKWATTMLSVDPDDPGTWRDITTHAARCGLITEAAIATVGMTFVGGTGTVGSVERIAAARNRFDSSAELRHELAAAIAGLAAAAHEPMARWS
ncbi:MAG: hypothetical protein HOW71_42885 [Nonomuraea sp.]|nr:hypothetical protein [Nonomuraea sp.]